MYKRQGKTRLIQGFVPAACRELNLKAVKVAYVFGDELNGQDIAKVVDKLSGGFLVIEQANQLSADTVEQLNKACLLYTSLGPVPSIIPENNGDLSRFSRIISCVLSLV